MTRIFISYRRDDTSYQARMIYDAFCQVITSDSVFMDIDSIPPGADFHKILKDWVDECDVLLALIGPDWIDATDPRTGRRRLDNPDDFVRIEIAEALTRGIPVVPVLIDRTPMPDVDRLPVDLKKLIRRQAVCVEFRTFDSDVERLIRRMGLGDGEAAQVQADASSSPPTATPEAAEASSGAEGRACADSKTVNGAADAVRQQAEEAVRAETSVTEAAEAAEAKPAKVPETEAAGAEQEPLPREAEERAKQKRVKAGGGDLWRRPGLFGAGAVVMALMVGLFLWREPNDPAPPPRQENETQGTTEKVKPPENTTRARVDAAITAATTAGELLALIKRYPDRRDDVLEHGLGLKPRIELVEIERGFNLGKVWIQAGVGNPFWDCDRAKPWCPTMVVASSGSFIMGSPRTEKGRTAEEGTWRTVTFDRPFGIGKFEVTFAEWDQCHADGACKHKADDEGWGRGRRPVVNVSWNDITKQYLPWLNSKLGLSGKGTYRLLTEAEWEYAARAGTTKRFAFGDSISKNQAHFSAAKTVDVGSFKPNALGLYDMHGNVWEWVEDCWADSYKSAPTDGSARTAADCSSRVLRGGSWGNPPVDLRAAFRNRGRPGHRQRTIGFRLARTLDP